MENKPTYINKFYVTQNSNKTEMNIILYNEYPVIDPGDGVVKVENLNCGQIVMNDACAKDLLRVLKEIIEGDQNDQ